MKKTISAGLLAVIICAALLIGWNYFLVRHTNQRISRVVGNMPVVENLEYEKLKVGLTGNWFSLGKVTLKLNGIQETISANEIHIPHYRTENNHLVSLQIEIKGAGILSKDVNHHDSFIQYGIKNPEDIISIITWLYQYDPHHKLLTLENINIRVPGLGELTAEIRLNNFDPSVVSINSVPGNSISGFFPYLMGISISQSYVSYRACSLLQNSPLEPDTGMHSSLSIYLNSLSEKIWKMVQKEKELQTRKVLENILEFLNNPQQVHVTLSPSKPVPFGRFLWVRHFRDVVQLLNMQVEM